MYDSNSSLKLDFCRIEKARSSKAEREALCKLDECERSLRERPMEHAVQMITELCNHPFRGGSCYWAQAAYRRRSTKKATSEATRLPEGSVPF